MKDIGLGVLDPYTVVIVLITFVLAQTLFGNQIPLDTANATQLFVSAVVFTGYLYLARSLFRSPVAAIRAWIILNETQDPKGILPRWHGFRKFHWTLRDILFFLLWTPVLFLLFLMDVFDFSNASLNEKTLSKRLNRYYENIWLRFFLAIVDRVGIVFIAFLSTLPFAQGLVQALGIIGLGVMVVFFVLKGNFAALLKDELGKKSNEEKKVVEKESTRINTNEPEKDMDKSLNISTCQVCGKPAAYLTGQKDKPILCSTECRQVWFHAWNKDKEIGFGTERQLIEEQRKTEYQDFSQFEHAVAELEKLSKEFPVSEAIWALIAMLRDLNSWGGTNEHSHYVHLLTKKLKLVLEKTTAGKNILLAILLDGNNSLVYQAITMLNQLSYDYEWVNPNDVETLLDHEWRSIRIAAIEFLGREKPLEIIFNQLEKHEPEIDTYIIQTMKLRGEEAIPWLKKAQTHHLRWIRKDATKALKELGVDTKEPEMIIQNVTCPSCEWPVNITYPRNFIVTQKDVYKLNIFRRTKHKNLCKHCGTRIAIKLKADWHAAYADELEEQVSKPNRRTTESLDDML